MQFTFLDMAGKVLFLRDDAEAAQWTVEEMSLDMDFPLDPDKVISIGQRVFFKDPATGKHQIYEIKQPRTYTPESYQQIHAENICISELSDEHIDSYDSGKHAATYALRNLLNNTLWTVGNSEINPQGRCEFSRGSVWQAILQLCDSWNVAVVPNLTLNPDGTITRKLDIVNPKGTFRGLRLSIDKNLLDPCVAYDDTGVATALFGYGGTIQPTNPKDEAKTCDFTDVVWKKENGHPAKPKGQKYLEDKEATRVYGRNGRPRYGYYQNSDITDPEELLEKTWETLRTVSVPDVSIEGSVCDLYRLGYADKPLVLREIAIVEIKPYGFKTQLQLNRMTVDLLDGTATVVTIGAYIPNIVYIARNTNEQATGSRGGGGGNKGTETERRELEAKLEAINDGAGIRIRAFQNDLDDMDSEVKKQEGRIDVLHNQILAEVTDRTEKDKKLQGAIDITASRVAMVVSENGIKAAEIVTAINDGSGSIILDADHVDVTGILTSDVIKSFDLQSGSLTTGNVKCTGVDATGHDITAQTATFSQDITSSSGYFEDVEITDTAEIKKMKFDGDNVTWKQETIPVLTFSDQRYFAYIVAGETFRQLGYIITAKSTHTIHYMGK